VAVDAVAVQVYGGWEQVSNWCYVSLDDGNTGQRMLIFRDEILPGGPEIPRALPVFGGEFIAQFLEVCHEHEAWPIARQQLTFAITYVSPWSQLQYAPMALPLSKFGKFSVLHDLAKK
jgi:hypothetical protein